MIFSLTPSNINDLKNDSKLVSMRVHTMRKTYILVLYFRSNTPCIINLDFKLIKEKNGHLIF